MANKQTLDTREIMNGTDGCLFIEFDGVNIPLLEIENYSISMNVNTVDRQFVGDPTIKAIPTGVSYTLTVTETVVRDDVIMEPMLAAIASGKFPHYNFQSKSEKPDGQEQRFALNDVVPSGEFGLQNITPGELVSRPMNFRINNPPKFLSALAATYM